MPRDISGTYTLPLAPIEPRTIPVVNWVNPTVEDIAAALNNIPGDALAPGSVGNTQLADNAVTGPKVQNGSIPLTKLQGLPAVPGMLAFTGMGLEARTITGTANQISVSNGSGAAGNPVLSIPSSPEFGGTVSLLGGQLAFPATQNPSTDPNTLDDYEEGTWTPTLTCSTPGDLVVAYSATNRTGQYQKVGNTVHFQFRIDTTTFTHTTAAGTTLITGLPFVPKDLGYPGAASGWICSALINGLRHSTLSFSPFLAIQSGVANFFLGVLTGQPATNSVNVTGITDIHTSGVNAIIMGGGSYQV